MSTSVPYKFANTPNGSTIPLNQLDADFQYVLDLIGDGLQVVQSFSGGTTGLTPATAAEGQIVLGGILSLANGGTGAQSAAQAANNILPNQSGIAGRFLTTDGQGDLSWTVGGTGTVKSVGLTTSLQGITISNSPITDSGTINISGILDPFSGGTGIDCSQAIGGSLLIGDGSGFKLAQLTAGQNVTITNANGSITISASPTISGVASISGGSTGLTFGTGTGAVTMAGTVAISAGGTGQTNAQAAINNLCGGVTSGQYLRGNGTNMVLSPILAADITAVGTLSNNTSGNAATATTLSGTTQNVQFNSIGLGVAPSGTAGVISAPTIRSTAVATPPVFQDSAGTNMGVLCRAWINFGYNGSTVTVRASYNATATRVSTGIYNITFTNPMPSANYAVTGITTAYNFSGPQSSMIVCENTNTPNTYALKTASSVQIATVDNNSDAYYDAFSCNVMIFA
jgi:hypothetical protein